MIKYIFCLSLLLLTHSGLAKTSPEIEEFDIRFYNPVSFKLSDLVFEVRIDNLKDMLNKRKSLGELQDLYAKVYWVKPNHYEIVINGLPQGFVIIKNEIKEIIKNYLNYVIPEKLGNRIKGYDIKRERKGKETIIRARDKSYRKAITDVNFFFDNRGRLLRYKTIGLNGMATYNLSLGIKSWSRNKWILEKLLVDNGRTFTEHEIEYNSYKGFGFPKKINTRSYRKGKKDKGAKAALSFQKYEINTGKAKRFMASKIKR